MRVIRTPEEPDSELVARALGGDQASQALLYKRHVRMVRGLAHRLLGGQDVDDLVQDAFVTAFERLPSLKDPQAFARWLGTIVVFSARKRIRALQRARSAMPLGEVEHLVSASAPPEVRLELQAIYSILGTLPEDVRIALVLRRIEGLSIADIAACMDRSPATVKRRISDGDFLLKSAMEREQHGTQR